MSSDAYLTVPTVGQARRDLALKLQRAGFESPQLDARLLVEAATDLSAEQLALDPDRPLASTEHAALQQYATRRLNHEPVSRILGVKAFYGRLFDVSRATLDPRPESETLIDVALEVSQRERWTQRPVRILDVGTGTGCLLLTLLAELPFATGVGSDPSAAALDVARANGDRLGLAERAQWIKTASLNGLAGPFDLVVANPPYIASGEIDGLPLDVKLFDPHVALDGGRDGLDVYRQILPSVQLIAPRGWIILETGATQADAVRAIICHTQYGSQPTIRTRLDLNGHTRCVFYRTQ